MMIGVRRLFHRVRILYARFGDICQLGHEIEAAMPPQPLNRVLSKPTNLSTSPLSLQRYPHLTVFIAQIIAGWAQLDATFGVMLTRMLEGSAKSSLAMYSTFQSVPAKIEALTAVAELSLTVERLALFKAIMKALRAVSKKRNPIAHDLWGFTEDLSDAYVLLPASAVHNHHASSGEYMAAWRAGKPVPDPATLPGMDHSRAMVYRERDFHEIIQEIEELHNIASSFVFMLIIDEPHTGKIYQRLISVPRIKTAIEAN